MLGAPEEITYPGVTELPDWPAMKVKLQEKNGQGRKYVKPANLKHLVKNMSDDGVDLLARMLEYDPAKRITAKAAMDHPYFNDLSETIRQKP